MSMYSITYCTHKQHSSDAKQHKHSLLSLFRLNKRAAQHRAEYHIIWDVVCVRHAKLQCASDVNTALSVRWWRHLLDVTAYEAPTSQEGLRRRTHPACSQCSPVCSQTWAGGFSSAYGSMLLKQSTERDLTCLYNAYEADNESAGVGQEEALGWFCGCVIGRNIFCFFVQVHVL